MYDTDDPANDDQLPFGTDDGADTVWDWVEHRDELLADPRLDTVLGGELVIWAADADFAEEAALHLVAAGFTLLRYTGTIDLDGRRVLLRALQSLIDTTMDAVFEQMYDDVITLPAAGCRARPAEPTGPRPPVRRPGPWLTINGGNDPAFGEWLRQIAQAVIADPDWSAWWLHAPVPRLELLPAAVGPPGGFLDVERRRSGIRVIGASAELALLMQPYYDGEEELRDDTGIHRSKPEAARLFRRLIHTMVRRVADELGMPSPPPTLPGPH